jgi:uncharacterized membrane protein
LHQQPQNVNLLHAAEKAAAGLNTKIAVKLTEWVGSMWTAYVFALLALLGLCSIFGLLPPVVVIFIAWLSQTFIQLVLLPVIMVGQNVLGRHAELLAEEEYKTTVKTFTDSEQLLTRLATQEDILLQHTALLQQLVQAVTKP